MAIRKRKKNTKVVELKTAIIKYLLSLSIALIASLFSFFLQKVFGLSL